MWLAVLGDPAKVPYDENLMIDSLDSESVGKPGRLGNTGLEDMVMG